MGWVARSAAWRLRAGILLAVVAFGCGAGCSQPTGSAGPVIEVDAPVALADAPVRVRITGLPAGAVTVVSAEANDSRGQVWTAAASFRTDREGVVDLARDAPISGSYAGVDDMGLFWSMNQPAGAAGHGGYFYPPWPELSGAFEVRLSVRTGGREVAYRSLSRQWASAGVTHRALDLAADNVAGDLFLPPPGPGRRPGILAFGGSSGGVDMKFEAALLASHGYPTLALAYFRAPGLPATLQDIPLEYLAAAAHLLARQPAADPASVAVMGYSRGSEAALLLAEHYPDLVRGVVLYAPTATVWPGFPDGGNAWTINGAPVPQTAIPLAHIADPVLAIAGGDDQVWPAAASARQIINTLDAADAAHRHQALIYPNAGHGVGTIPYLAAGTAVVHPVTRAMLHLGGTRAADAAARRDAWPKVLAFLEAVPPVPPIR